MSSMITLPDYLVSQITVGAVSIDGCRVRVYEPEWVEWRIPRFDFRFNTQPEATAFYYSVSKRVK